MQITQFLVQARSAGDPTGPRQTRLGLTLAALTGLLLVALWAPAPLRSAWVLLLLAPVCEELIFREGVQASLQRALHGHGPLAPHLAVAGSTLAFGLAHALLRSPALGWAVLVPGLLLAECHRRTRRCLPCMAWHSAFNGLWWLASATGPLPFPPTGLIS